MTNSCSLRVDDLMVSITWKRMKNIRLKILPPAGDVVVSAPIGVSVEWISHFVREHRSWIDRKRDQLLVAALDVDRLGHGGAIRLWGQWYGVEHREEGRPHAWIADRRLIVTGNDEKARERAIDRFRRNEVERISRPLLDSWVITMGVPRPTAVRYRVMHTRWGSCNHHTRAITLNVALVRFPVAAVEYVAVHELAHLRYADHGRGFWSLVAAALPDHVERRKLLETRMT